MATGAIDKILFHRYQSVYHIKAHEKYGYGRHFFYTSNNFKTIEFPIDAHVEFEIDAYDNVTYVKRLELTVENLPNSDTKLQET